jgi:hypothetical protein
MRLAPACTMHITALWLWTRTSCPITMERSSKWPLLALGARLLLLLLLVLLLLPLPPLLMCPAAVGVSVSAHSSRICSRQCTSCIPAHTPVVKSNMTSNAGGPKASSAHSSAAAAAAAPAGGGAGAGGTEGGRMASCCSRRSTPGCSRLAAYSGVGAIVMPTESRAWHNRMTCPASLRPVSVHCPMSGASQVASWFIHASTPAGNGQGHWSCHKHCWDDLPAMSHVRLNRTIQCTGLRTSRLCPGLWGASLLCWCLCPALLLPQAPRVQRLPCAVSFATHP